VSSSTEIQKLSLFEGGEGCFGGGGFDRRDYGVGGVDGDGSGISGGGD